MKKINVFGWSAIKRLSFLREKKKVQKHYPACLKGNKRSLSVSNFIVIGFIKDVFKNTLVNLLTDISNKDSKIYNVTSFGKISVYLVKGLCIFELHWDRSDRKYQKENIVGKDVYLDFVNSYEIKLWFIYFFYNT